MNQLLMMPFSELSTEALIESRDKYAKTIVTNTLKWIRCSICEEVENYNKIIPCEYTCPLAVSRWCRDGARDSKLHKQYDVSHKCEPWEKRLNDYVMWIDIEIEDRYKEDEKWW